MNWDKISFVAFVIALCFFAAVYGVFAERYSLFPISVANYFERLHLGSGITRDNLAPIRYQHSGVRIYDRAAISPGVTLLTSFWHDEDDLAGVRLIDADGRVLHSWTAKVRDIWPQSPYDDYQGAVLDNRRAYIHGAHLFPNGDVLFNFETLGAVRMDACGKVIWKLPFRTHHSVAMDDDGTFWLSALRWVEPDSPRAKLFPILHRPFAEPIALHITADGKILRAISLLEILYRSPLKRLLPLVQELTDLVHLNRVEPLSKRLAPHFPMFAPGDLLVSMRNINLVMVTSQDGVIKWFDTDHFSAQHDPHFEADGTISVFDNRPENQTADGYEGGSAVISIRPDTGELKTLYPTDGAPPFFTRIGGKQQRLANGNLLITEARAGRVFEAAPSGRIVWDWIQAPYEEKYVPEVLQGARYPISPETVAGWGCS